MPHPQLDRFAVRHYPLAERENKKHIERDHVPPGSPPGPLPDRALEQVAEAAGRIRRARHSGRPVMVAFGAHAIKNGLGPVFADLLQKGWITHLATNGAGIIHDWEFAFQGASCEHVGPMVAQGRFGNWQETGYYINLALNVGAFLGLGYGEAIGAMIESEALEIPSCAELERAVRQCAATDPRRAAAAADLRYVVERFQLGGGTLSIPHPYRRYSVQAAAHRLRLPFTGHPMIGHDIIYNHPMNCGAALGRAAERDFLAFAHGVSQLQGGAYVSIGSAVMSPMIFEKALSMAQNLALQAGGRIDDHYILVNDLAPCEWDWSRGEPPEDDPAYYLRYNKTFSRMGGTLRYLQADNRDFLLALARELGAPA